MQSFAQRAHTLRDWGVKHHDVVFTLLVTATMRVWYAVWGAAVIITHGTPIVPNPPTLYHGLPRVPDEGLGLLLAPWQRWDAIWYLRIAQFGYAPNDLSPSFFPAYPLLTRLVTLVIPDYLLAGLIVSTSASFLAFLFLYRLCADLTDRATAQRAVLYFALFPTAFFLFAPYAESLLVAGSLASIYFARRREWGPAALAGIMASLARPFGFIIALPLAFEAWQAKERRASGVVAVGSIFVAALGWIIYLPFEVKDALVWLDAQSAWQRGFVMPGQTVLWTVQGILSGQGPVANNLVDLSLTGVVFVAILVAWRKLPLPLSVYALLMIAVPLLNFTQVSGYELAPMASAGRRALAAFPAFLALAMACRGKWKEPLWFVSSAVTQTLLFVVFVQWLWVD